MVVVVLICILFGGLYQGAAKVILLHPCGLVESYVIISDLEYFQFLNMNDKIDYSSLNQYLRCSFAFYRWPISKISVLLLPGYIMGWLRNIRHKCSFRIFPWK